MTFEGVRKIEVLRAAILNRKQKSPRSQPWGFLLEPYSKSATIQHMQVLALFAWGMNVLK
jgi:hypothetical protein